MTGYRPPWPQQAVHRLRQLHEQDMSYAQIANVLNYEFQNWGFRISKNSAVGMAHRLRLPDRKRGTSRKGINQVHLGTLAPAAGLSAGPPRLLAPRPAPAQPVAWPAAVPAAPRRKLNYGNMKLVDLTVDMCHHPYGEHAPYKYCGRQTEEGKPYCADHCRMHYIGTARRGRSAA